MVRRGKGSTASLKAMTEGRAARLEKLPGWAWEHDVELQWTTHLDRLYAHL